jgi:hypothetical protein
MDAMYIHLCNVNILSSVLSKGSQTENPQQK